MSRPRTEMSAYSRLLPLLQASKKGESASERALQVAPPGYSEHHTVRPHPLICALSMRSSRAALLADSFIAPVAAFSFLQGYAVDIGASKNDSLTEAFEGTKQFKWLQARGDGGHESQMSSTARSEEKPSTLASPRDVREP